MFPNKSNQQRDLYGLFRDGIFADAIRGQTTFSEWDFVRTAHVGRQATNSLVRKMIKRMEKQFPSGFVWKGGKITLTPDFVMFIRTHIEMGSTEEEAIDAWSAMRSITE